jgi:hypothetical protein
MDNYWELTLPETLEIQQVRSYQTQKKTGDFPRSLPNNQINEL